MRMRTYLYRHGGAIRPLKEKRLSGPVALAHFVHGGGVVQATIEHNPLNLLTHGAAQFGDDRDTAVERR